MTQLKNSLRVLVEANVFSYPENNQQIFSQHLVLVKKKKKSSKMIIVLKLVGTSFKKDIQLAECLF